MVDVVKKRRTSVLFCKIHAAFTLAFTVLKSVLNNSYNVRITDGLNWL